MELTFVLFWHTPASCFSNSCLCFCCSSRAAAHRTWRFSEDTGQGELEQHCCGEEELPVWPSESLHQVQWYRWGKPRMGCWAVMGIAMGLKKHFPGSWWEWETWKLEGENETEFIFAVTSNCLCKITIVMCPALQAKDSQDSWSFLFSLLNLKFI